MAVGSLLLVLLPGVVASPAAAERESTSERPVAASSVATGGRHTCAVVRDGDVQCWGDNGDGQLGYGDEAARYAPAGAVSLPRPTAGIALGDGHSCALLVNGAVWCWGDNAEGQIGDGTLIDRTAPVRVVLGQRATAVSANRDQTCALLASGAVKCWGDNSSGQLGTGDTGSRTVPTPVDLDGARALSVAVGDRHTCAVLGSRDLRCWGDNDAGQLGVGDTTDRLLPTPVALDLPVRAVAADASHTCVVVAGGAVRCWGSDAQEQLGNGSDGWTDEPAGPVGLGGTAIAITAGDAQTCALLADGWVRCWGDGGRGRLGTGDTADQPIPVAVPLGRRARAVSSDAGHVCAVLATGGLRCWGTGSDGQLGYGDVEDRGGTPDTAPSLLPDVALTDQVRTRAHTRLRMTVEPRRDRRPPFRWRIDGRVSGPFIPDPATCVGLLKIKVFKGERIVARRTSHLRRDCTFHGAVRVWEQKVRRHQRTRLRVQVRLARSSDLERAVAGRRIVAR